MKECARCPSNESREGTEQAAAPPQLMNWNDLHRALAKLPYSGGLGEVPKNLIIRGTVSRVELALPGASVPWVNVYFRESAEQRTNVQGQTFYGAFDVCSSNPDIFKDLFGADFRTNMIGKAVEVEGNFQRAYCNGWRGSIRLSLARQMRVIDSALIDSPGPRPISAVPPEAPGAVSSNPRPPASMAPPAQPVSKNAAAPAATIAPPAAAPATAPPATSPAQAAAPATTAPDPATAAAAQAKALQDQQDRTAQRRADAQQQRQQQMAEHQKQVQERAAKIAACRQQAAKDHPEGGADVVKAFTSCIQTLQAK